MAEYIGQRIIDGTFKYEYASSKKPTLKVGIDAYLTEDGREDLITVTTSASDENIVYNNPNVMNIKQ